jgi:MFS family permease
MAALLNHVDRNVFGLLAVSIQKDLHISNQKYASIINYFLVSYTIANLLSGRVVDKLGVRLSLALFLGWWTIANALTGLAQAFMSPQQLVISLAASTNDDSVVNLGTIELKQLSLADFQINKK